MSAIRMKIEYVNGQMMNSLGSETIEYAIRGNSQDINIHEKASDIR